VKAIHILLTGAALSVGLMASAVAQQPAPTPKGDAVPPRTEQPKAQPDALPPKPVEAACKTPHLDLYPKDELRPMTGKAPDPYLPPVIPTTKWGGLCKLGTASATGSLQRS
jgi:hypothetical protein